MKSIKVSCNLLDDFICRLFINDISWEFLIDKKEYVNSTAEFIDKDNLYELLLSILSLSRSLDKSTASPKYGNHFEILYTQGIGLELRCYEVMDSVRLLNEINRLFGKE